MNKMNSDVIRSLRRVIICPLRRFAKNKKGTTAIEFGAVALPFFALLFAIIETGIVFLANQNLETAVADSARLILTGQAQNGGMDQGKFKDAVCDEIHGLFDCSKISVDVRSFANFSSISFDPPTADSSGNLDPNQFTYDPGGPGQIVVVRLLYQLPIHAWLWNPSIQTDTANHNRLLVATAAFRNEPYGP